MDNNGLGNLGYTLLAVLFLFIGVGSIVSPAILKVWGTKKCLLVGGISHFIFVFSQILPAWRAEYFQDPQKHETTGMVAFL
jgi:hypothetical protein